MKPILDFVRLDDLVPLFLLALCLRAVGTQAVGNRPKVKRHLRVFAYLGFLGFFMAAIAEYGPKRPDKFLELAVRSLIAGELLRSIASILYPLIVRIPSAFKTRTPTKISPPPVLEKPRVVKQTPPPLPPPPSIEARRAEVERQRDERLKTIEGSKLDAHEAAAAREEIQQRYLREIDGLLR